MLLLLAVGYIQFLQNTHNKHAYQTGLEKICFFHNFKAWPMICYAITGHGPLVRYVKLRVAHAPGTFFPPPRASDPDMHRGTCVTHVPWCMPGSLTSPFLWSWWRWKRSRHSQCMRNVEFFVSGKKPITLGMTLDGFVMRGEYLVFWYFSHWNSK